MPAKGFRRVRRGSALVTVLMVVAMAVILSSALIGSAFFQLNLSMNFDNAKVARNLADSAVAAAAQQLMANYPSSTPTGIPPDVVISGPTGGLLFSGSPNGPGYNVASNSGNVVLERPDTGTGRVTFNQSGSLPWSLDNLGPNTVSTTGYRAPGSTPQVVPQNAMHLIGIGTYKGTTVYTDAIIWVPPYPYAIAASGKININGTVIVGSVPTSASASASGSIVPTSSLLPAAMGDTNTGAPAISMSPGSGQSVYVAGDVETMGTVYENGTVVINGSLVQNSGSFPIPSVTVTSYDPSGQAGCNTLSPCGAATTLQLTGYNVVTPLSGTYTAQNINLNGGILYVKGSLNAQTISGNGAIMAEGNVTINQDANLSSDDTLALLANGNVTLNGTDQSTSTFKGLLYTQGNLTANNLTVIGEYVANGGGTTSVGDVTLNNSNVIVANDKTTLTNWPSSTATSSGCGGPIIKVGACACLCMPVTCHPVPKLKLTSKVSYNGSAYVYTLCAVPSGGTFTPTHVTYTMCGSPPQAVCAGPCCCTLAWHPAPPSAMINSFKSMFSKYGFHGAALCYQAGVLAQHVDATATAQIPWGTHVCLGGVSTPTPVPMTPNPFSFNNFLTNPTSNARVLMWQPYLP